MRLSTKGRYGVMAMFDLAHYGGRNPVPLNEVARRQGISESYLEQLMAPLRRQGLVHSTRGAQGGYLLARPAEQITVGDVIRVLEGPIAPVDCVALEGDLACCSKFDQCITRTIWARLRDSMVKVLDSITLADLCREAEEAETAAARARPARAGPPAGAVFTSATPSAAGIPRSSLTKAARRAPGAVVAPGAAAAPQGRGARACQPGRVETPVQDMDQAPGGLRLGLGNPNPSPSRAHPRR